MDTPLEPTKQRKRGAFSLRIKAKAMKSKQDELIDPIVYLRKRLGWAFLMLA